MKESKINIINSKSNNSEIRRFFIDTTIDIVKTMTDKVMNGKVRNGENEKIRIQQYKTIINACNVGNRILKDKQLDEYEKDITSLKNGLLSKEYDDELSEDIIELDKLDEEIKKLKEE